MHDYLVWYALQVQPRHEKAVSSILRNKGHEEFLPLYRVRRKWKRRYVELELPLFAGYVFCRFGSGVKTPVVTSPGVLGIVGFDRSAAPIDDAEIDALKRVMASGLKVEPCSYLAVGDRVRIHEGPLAGLEGILLEIRNLFRVVLSVNLLRQSIVVEVDRDWIVPCGRNGAPRILAVGS